MSQKTRHKNYKCVSVLKGACFYYGRKAKINYKTRLEIVEKRVKKGKSISELSKIYDISKYTVNSYILLYQKFGKESLKLRGKRNTAYPLSFKNEVVKGYLAGKSKIELSIEYQVSKSVVFNWIKQYNNQLKDYIPQGEVYTMTSKKYSKKEKENIILECIQSKKDYKSIYSKYKIRYALLYQWVRSYEINEKLKPMQLAQSNEERLEILLKLKEIEKQALRDELEILKKTTKFTR